MPGKCPRLATGGNFTPALWDRFAAWLDGELRALTLQKSSTTRVIQDSGGQMVEVIALPGASGSSQVPFTVVTQPKPGSTSGEVQWGVIYDSKCYLGIGPVDPSTITGLLSSSPTTTDAGWKTISATDVIFLEWNSSGIFIKSNGASPSFTVGASAWTSGSWIEASGTPEVWSITRKVIATATITGTGTSSVLSVTQLLKANQQARPVSVVGRAGWWFFDIF